MTFALNEGASPEDIVSAVNYLLANIAPSNYSNEQTGEIINSGGQIIGYLYKYIFIKYADSFDGSNNFSNSPTNRQYYGVRNSNSSTESTNPTDYVWNQVTGGFGTTKFLWYLTTGGRQIQFQVATTQPNTGWTQDPGTAIDLDVITAAASSPANFIINRITNDSSAPTDVECVAAIGRTPISGDLCTVVYNSGISSILYKYTTGWAAYIAYISTDLLLAGAVKATNIDVSQLSAISADLGTVTAGSLNINNKFLVDSSGNTIIRNATTGARLLIQNDVIKVYDSAGVLRVQIGDLTV